MEIQKTGLESLNTYGVSRNNVQDSGGKDFSKWLSENIAKVEELQKGADSAAGDLIAGRKQNLHETMIAIQEAEISFKLMMEVRNKLINAYEVIQRMQF